MKIPITLDGEGMGDCADIMLLPFQGESGNYFNVMMIFSM